VSIDDTAVDQGRLEDKQLEEKTNTDCLVKEHEKVHHGVDVGAVTMKNGVPGQDGAKGNAAERYREDSDSKWKAGLKEDMDVRSDVYVLSNGCRKSSDDSHDYYWEYAPGDCDVEKNGKWSYTYAVGSQEYQVVCTRPDIASAGVDMLDEFDRGLQTNVQVFVDFDYAMGRSITVMTLGWILEEIRVTRAHLEKKRTRLRTYTKSHDDFCKQWLEMASQALSDAVVINPMIVLGLW
ncbi:hypothetical protein Tco_1422940, partial [Tanacetum coccineum]